MKKVEQYFLSVEGYNEKWYFEHLQNLINNIDDENSHNVKFNIKIDKSPLSRRKSLTLPILGRQKLKVFHISDYESNNEEHIKNFQTILDELKTIKTKYTDFDYKLGYSNFAFELWLILHKDKGRFSVEDRSRYIEKINTLYGTNFAKLKDSKDEANFSKLLGQITLDDVKTAVKNAHQIRQYQQDIGHNLVEYKGFKYYRENPDLTVNECVEKILKSCGICV